MAEVNGVSNAVPIKVEHALEQINVEVFPPEALLADSLADFSKAAKDVAKADAIAVKAACAAFVKSTLADESLWSSHKKHSHKVKSQAKAKPKPAEAPKTESTPKKPEWDKLFATDIDEYLKQSKLWGREP